MRTPLVRTTEIDYQVIRRNAAWADHKARALVTGALVAWLEPDFVLDPACGDGSVFTAANDLMPIDEAMLADISLPNYEAITRWLRPHWRAWCAPIEETLAIQTDRKYDVTILTEILEHLPDPDDVLRRVRPLTKHLVASSPIMRPGQVDTNPEHRWMFDREGYEQMLAGAGYGLMQFTFLRFPTMYDFGVWVCS